jgi:hypothetical protein
MSIAAAWLVWSTMMNFVAGIHADGDRLRLAARNAGIPEIVMEGIAAVESGYRGGNEFLGKAGEVGRMQIMAKTAVHVGCGEPLLLEDYDYNIACGAKILRFCRDKYYPDWSLGIRCYQGMAVPEMTKDYLMKVQREIGRLTLARLNEQEKIAAAKAKAKKPPVKPRKRVVPPAPAPAPGVDSTTQTVARAISY